MSATLIDKKYRDGVPGCISLIDVQDPSGDDVNQANAKGKMRKSIKKIKPGKTGLYPTEDILIRRWWASHDNDVESGAPGASREETMKSRIAQLRIRETQLQMIIILEVLALQPLASASEDVGGGLPTALPTSVAAERKEDSIKSKKPDHLTMLTEVHIDRLCIWQSIALEAVKPPLGDVDNPSETNSLHLPSHTENFLRDFCVDVIAPL